MLSVNIKDVAAHHSFSRKCQQPGKTVKRPDIWSACPNNPPLMPLMLHYPAPKSQHEHSDYDLNQSLSV